MSNLVEKWFDKLGDRFAEEGARVRAVIESGLAQTLNAQRINAARPAPLLPNGMNSTSRGRLVGWSLQETSGTAGAVVTLYGARDAGDPGAVVAVIPLATGAGSSHLPAGPGVFFGDGLYAAVTGAAAGALYFAAAD